MEIIVELGDPLTPPIFMLSKLSAVIEAEAMVVLAARVEVHSKTVRIFVPTVAGVEDTLKSICIVEEPDGRE